MAVWSHVSVLLQVIVSCLSQTPECKTPHGTCACYTDLGLIDLSPLDSRDPSQPKFKNVKDPEHQNLLYSYNPCTAFTEEACKAVAVCLEQTADTGKLYYNLGDADTVEWKTDSSAEKLFIVYTTENDQGIVRSSVDLQCDPNDPGTLLAKGETYSGSNEYGFTLISQYACPGEDVGFVLSAGSIICIVILQYQIDCLFCPVYSFLALTLIYFVLGWTCNVVGKNARGCAAIPHHDFWAAMPGLVQDGCCFIARCCRATSRTVSYELL